MLTSPDGAQTHIFMTTSTVSILRTAYYGIRMVLILISVFRIVKDGGQQYFTPYFRLRKPEVLLRSLLHILEDGGY